MKTAEEQFFQEWQYSPAGREWDKFEKQAKYFDAESMIDFAERYSDQQNKELREKHSKLENEYGKLYSNYYDMGLRKTMWEAGERKNEENTRLRELLDGSKDLLLVASTGYAQIEFLERVKKLITEIDNALDPSGPHAMGPGH